MQTKRKVFLYTVLLILTGIILFKGGDAMSYETPNYKAEKHANGIEIRTYPSLLVAEVTTTGTRKDSISDAFRLLADFIFGNNAPQAKIAMTTPVVQEQGAKIAMTTPVVQEESGQGWKTRFVMPKEYTLETLPKPNNNAVKIYKTLPKKVAAIRFSWRASDSNIAKHEKILSDFIAANNLKTKAEATYAYYDPPWTLPFFRRNEVMFEIIE
jgi:hypothetical protein